MPNSGAFRSLHCLIYKVLARAAQRRNIWYLTTFSSICQVLFSTFFKIFFVLSFPSRRLSDGLVIISGLPEFVKHFFRVSWKLFRTPPPRRLRLRQLADSSRFPSVCQVLFQTFFKLLSPARCSCSFPSWEALLFYHLQFCLSSLFSTFFKLFLPCRPFALPCRTAQLI